MNDGYENVEWNVHATTDAMTPLVEGDDPLSTLIMAPEEGGFSGAIADREAVPQRPPASYASLETRSVTPELEDTPPPMPHSPSMDRIAASNSSTFAPTAMTIRIGDPQKHVDTQGAFVTYLITTMTAVATFASLKPRPVRRRFQDFAWLHNVLMLEFPACIIPPLPEKHRLEYIKGDRFSTDFIERRRQGLQWFLDRLSRHPMLQTSQSVRIFLESPDFQNDKRTQSHHVPPASSVFETWSDSLINAFAKVKKPEECFVEMKDTVDKLEGNLNTVERLYSRISKRQQDLQLDYASFASSIQGLSALETGMTQPLHQVAEAVKAYVKAMADMRTMEENGFLNEIHELLAYCHATKAVLRARDQKQVDFEELSAYLQRTLAERDRAKHPGRHHDGGLNITEYVMDRLNEVRGVDLERARREKVARLEQRGQELQEEVARTNDISNGFSSQVHKEYAVFQKAKTEDLRQGLACYADCHIEFFQKGVDIWKQLLPLLENKEDDEEGEL